MKINSINNQYNSSFNGKGKGLSALAEKTMGKIAQKPALVAALAGASVVAQKVVMSGSEATIAPVMDMAVGKAITKVTDEKDGKTMENSKTQAIRTFSQAVGGTIVGVIIRMACIAATTALLSKMGQKAGNKIAEIINPEKMSSELEKFNYTQKMEGWGKSVGGAVAVLIMLVTNFIIDAPFINWINKQSTKVLNKITNKNQEPQNQTNKNSEQAKEVK